MDKSAHLTRCPRCGSNLPADIPEGLCPACLSAIAVAGSPTVASQGETVSAVPPITQRHSVVQEPTGPAPGHTFGPYHIERLIGRGGMGDVYEADHIEQGRRVALKVLHQRLSGREDRARFLREGQLAASINHPHTVYIFGSDEIDGIPAIAMELLPGGTLKDRVKERGPLQPAAAVDAILQVIAGLEAMHAVGVLHRDVKPANCFVDSDGTVKVGDFGLSISTMARDVSQLTITGAFLGTPQFAAPEQLKGYPLDVRSDIYSVGATLYFLLTGRPPFEDRNLLAIVARIATEAPPSPRTVMPHVPRGLANIVLRCLAKDAADRPADYAALNDALRPFSSATPDPATLGLRLIAWAIDAALLSALTGLFNIRQAVKLLAPDGAAQDPFSPRWGLYVALFAIRIAYYGIQEGRWGASPGKRLLGLRVVIAGGGQPPGVARASWRALIFFIPTIPTILAPLFLDPRFMLTLVSGPWAPLVSLLPLAASAALLFSTARRRNGFAGVHELWSSTRVIQQLATSQRPSVESVRERSIVVGSSLRRVGPFDVIETVGRTAIGTLSVGYDPRLQRRVWLHELAVGASPVAPLVRDLKRPGRLRWLSDRRTSTERWDAYEALDGLPLLTLLDRPRPWRDVRQWLADLAQEMEAGLSDGSLGRLALDCVWITRDGRAKLLDFQVPGAVAAPGPLVPATAHTAQMFLGELATSALTGSKGLSSALGQRLRHSLPLSASALLDALAGPIGNWSDVVQRTTALLKGPDHVERWRRAASIGLACALPLGLFMFMATMFSMVMPAVRASMTPDNTRLMFAVSEVSLPSTSRDPAYRAALETYIAGRFGPILADPRFGTTPTLQAVEFQRNRRLIERIVADHPQVSADQMAAATAVIRPSFERFERAITSSQSMSLSSMSTRMLPTTFAITAVVAIVLAWLFRGGFLLHALDIVVVTNTGQPASRLRALWRGFVAWGIFLAPVLPLLPAPPWLIMYVVDSRLGIGACIIGLLGAAWAVVCPERGLQDRIAGTYLVPR